VPECASVALLQMNPECGRLWVRAPLVPREKDQRPDGSESLCVRLEQHEFPRIFLSLSLHYKDPTKRVGVVKSRPHHHHIDVATNKN
jgi:hypothetical protein